ncbi:hypothetical protein PGTUg99_014694 [Puccinia graminis f. sp. tritici]|uniref:Uncharacterized protein n=1 Tax=Puccinia graminis f. sp. tritici TaxID=56615 RepID=A0A5B0QLS1_PUCGR|nr:hypothetical protein PGTUg99_014694 [Puccinia graminis f. sp. tritici]
MLLSYSLRSASLSSPSISLSKGTLPLSANNILFNYINKYTGRASPKGSAVPQGHSLVSCALEDLRDGKSLSIFWGQAAAMNEFTADCFKLHGDTKHSPAPA